MVAFQGHLGVFSKVFGEDVVCGSFAGKVNVIDVPVDMPTESGFAIEANTRRLLIPVTGIAAFREGGKCTISGVWYDIRRVPGPSDDGAVREVYVVPSRRAV